MFIFPVVPYKGRLTPNINVAAANQALINKYTAAGLTNVKSKYVDSDGVFNVAAANKALFEKPKITGLNSNPSSFTKAVINYSNALAKARAIGITNLNTADQNALKNAAKLVRDFDSKDLSPSAKQIITNITGSADAIDEINNQRKLVEVQRLRAKNKSASGSNLGLSGKELESERSKLFVEQDKLLRLENAATNLAPKISESLSRFGLSDVFAGAGTIPTEKIQGIETGLSELSSGKVFGTDALKGRLNINVTDEQILNDINTANKNKYKSLYDTGTAVITDLQSQINQANSFLADLPAKDKRRADTQKIIDNLNAQLATAQKDTLQAKNLYENYQPISGTQAAGAISQFRESLRLPEERTLEQIKQIDPKFYDTIISLQDQYKNLATQPIGQTTSPETEAFRRDVEQRIAGQVALGSQLGAEEQRQYQQAARAAQAARGNIFGVAPAVEEAVTTGAAGEQRLAARLGAAQGFLSSGQTVSDALARDVALRNSLQQSRLGAAADFTSGGPTAYNLANQRAAQQQGVLSNYLAASRPAQTGGFQATPSANIPYAYVNQMAGFQGAQTAANVYNTLANYQAQTYGAQVGAISRQQSGAQQAASILGGISGFAGLFGAPGSSAFFRA